MRRCKAKLFSLVVSKVDDAFMKPPNICRQQILRERCTSRLLQKNADATLLGVKNSVMSRHGIARMKQIIIR